MQYLGGKSRLAKKIAAAVLENTTAREAYLEPFIGGGSVFEALAPNFTKAAAGDIHLDLVMMWEEAIFNGWVPPTVITEPEYQNLKHAEPSALRGFVGFGCAFGGRFFGGYARKSRGDTDSGQYAGQGSRAVARAANAVRPMTRAIRCYHYDQWTSFIRYGVVVYCDPPYANTTGYTSTDNFDHAAFWDTMREWVKRGADVFVSEYSAPDDWSPILEMPRKTMAGLHSQHGQFEVVDRLYMIST